MKLNICEAYTTFTTKTYKPIARVRNSDGANRICSPAGRIGAIFCGVHNASAIVNRERERERERAGTRRCRGADVVARRVTHSVFIAANRYDNQPKRKSAHTWNYLRWPPRITNCTRLIRQQSRSEIIGPGHHPVAENQLSLPACRSVTRRRLVEKEDLAVLISFGADTRGELIYRAPARAQIDPANVKIARFRMIGNLLTKSDVCTSAP